MVLKPAVEFHPRRIRLCCLSSLPSDSPWDLQRPRTLCRVRWPRHANSGITGHLGPSAQGHALPGRLPIGDEIVGPHDQLDTLIVGGRMSIAELHTHIALLLGVGSAAGRLQLAVLPAYPNLQEVMPLATDGSQPPQSGSTAATAAIHQHDSTSSCLATDVKLLVTDVVAWTGNTVIAINILLPDYADGEEMHVPTQAPPFPSSLQFAEGAMMSSLENEIPLDPQQQTSRRRALLGVNSLPDSCRQSSSSDAELLEPVFSEGRAMGEDSAWVSRPARFSGSLTFETAISPGILDDNIDKITSLYALEKLYSLPRFPIGCVAEASLVLSYHPSPISDALDCCSSDIVF